MPGENCSMYGCGTCRRPKYKGMGIFQVTEYREGPGNDDDHHHHHHHHHSFNVSVPLKVGRTAPVCSEFLSPLHSVCGICP